MELPPKPHRHCVRVCVWIPMMLQSGFCLSLALSVSPFLFLCVVVVTVVIVVIVIDINVVLLLLMGFLLLIVLLLLLLLFILLPVMECSVLPSTGMHSYRPAYHHVVAVVQQHSFYFT